MKKILSRYTTLRIRIPAIFLISLLLLAFSIISISFRRYERLNLDKHIQMAEGITTLMCTDFDVEKIDQYIEQNYSSEEYNELLKYYYTLKESYQDVQYMYVYKFFKDPEDGLTKGQVIIDLDEAYTENVPQESIDWIGSIVTESPEFQGDYEAIVNDHQCVWHLVDNDYGTGRLISFERPILDKNGDYLCSACVDFSLNMMVGRGIDFVVELLSVVAFIIISVLIMINIILNKILFKPIYQMTKCIESFKFDSELDRFNNVNRIEELNINVQNEIDGLYNALVLSMKDSAYYMSSLHMAQTEIKVISETAYKDALTGVSNKTSYNKTVAQLQRDINAKKGLKFAIVMVDINNLKYVNDTYGHELGDEYIKGCCNIVCKIFKSSPVFRIGGDEFVVIVTDDDYDNRNDNIDTLEDTFDRTYHDESVEKYARYSASFGIADYSETLDKDVGDVLKRADKQMYAFKEQFKKENGSYR